MKEVAAQSVYPFLPEIEQGIAIASCGEQRFWHAVGKEIDPKRLQTKEAQTIVTAVGAMFKSGTPPRGSLSVAQYLRNQVTSGKLELETMMACKAYLADAEEVSVTFEELLAVVAPVIQRERHKEVVKVAIEDFSKGRGPDTTIHELERVSKIGVVATTDSGDLATSIMDDAMLVTGNEVKCKTGVEDLDLELDGGLEQGGLGIFVGGSGAGKSLSLAHVAVQALLDLHDVEYITLELSRRMQMRRMVRNLVNMTQREIDLAPAEARRRHAMLKIGKLDVVYMEPLATSPRDIAAMIKQRMSELPGFNPKVFVVDFMDKVRVNLKASLYEDQLAVADGLRSIGASRDGWTWTASQSNREATHKQWLALDAVADSMNKIRSADMVIGIGRDSDDEENNTVRFSVPKRREGEGANAKVGPLPWDPEHGRIVSVTRGYPWE